MTSTATKWFIALILVLSAAATTAAYPSVTVATPYSEPASAKTTVIYNPWSGNMYINGPSASDIHDAYADGYYDGKYRRNPNFCRYDWFDRCKFDPDRAYEYYYDRCKKYDPSDDEWYDRNCDLYFGRYRPGSNRYDYDNRYYDYPSYDYGRDYRYDYGYDYPRLYVHYVDTVGYSDNHYYNW